MIEFCEDEVKFSGYTVHKSDVRGCSVKGFDIRLNVIVKEVAERRAIEPIDLHWGDNDCIYSPFWTLYVQNNDGTWSAICDRETRDDCWSLLQTIIKRVHEAS